MDSNGDMYNGNTIVNETDSHFTSNSTIEVNLGFQVSLTDNQRLRGPNSCLGSAPKQI